MIAKNWIFILLAILFTRTGIAANYPKMEIYSKERLMAILNFDADTLCAVEINFMYEDGEMVYHWKSEIPERKVKKVYELSHLTFSIYKVCINYGDNSIYCNLTDTDDRIGLGPYVKLSKPYFNFSDDLLKLSFLNVAENNVYLNVFQKEEFMAV
jgi:hypothetical protein